MVKLVCKFETELTVGEEYREKFNTYKLDGFKELKDNIKEMLDNQSDNPVTILEFSITE